MEIYFSQPDTARALTDEFGTIYKALFVGNIGESPFVSKISAEKPLSVKQIVKSILPSTILLII